MARHTKTKFAALAFSIVAAVGLIAVGPATSADAGHSPVVKMRNQECC